MDEELKRNLDGFVERWKRADELGLVRKRNIYIGDTKVAFALYRKTCITHHGIEHCIEEGIDGITERTYQKYKDYIDKKMEGEEVSKDE